VGETWSGEYCAGLKNVQKRTSLLFDSSPPPRPTGKGRISKASLSHLPPSPPRPAERGGAATDPRARAQLLHPFIKGATSRERPAYSSHWSAAGKKNSTGGLRSRPEICQALHQPKHQTATTSNAAHYNYSTTKLDLNYHRRHLPSTALDRHRRREGFGLGRRLRENSLVTVDTGERKKGVNGPLGR
jgi:hypothetical protein